MIPEVKAYMESLGFGYGDDGFWTKNVALKDADIEWVDMQTANFFYNAHIASTRKTLEEVQQLIPEYYQECEKYPDTSSWCNQCWRCKNRNRDEFVTGYEAANDEQRQKLDQMISALEREGE